MKVEVFGCIMRILCFTTGVPLQGWGTYAQKVHLRGLDVMSECCKVGSQPPWPEPMCTISSAQGTGVFLRWWTYAEI
jgi:hypothetical protein